jgi:hypothetical protein
MSAKKGRRKVPWIVLGTIVVLLVLGLVVVPLALRPWQSRWGATDAEVAAALPGDEFVTDPQSVTTRAITIDAPPETVYQLVVQTGYKRAGWYGWDWFYDMTGSGSFVDGHYSTRIVPALQDIKVGEKIYINPAVGYTVARTDPAKAFVLLARADTKTSTDIAPDAPFAAADKPAEYINDSWAWVMQRTAGGKTRLILRMRNDDRGGSAIMSAPPLDFGSFLFASKTMVGIKNTAEALASAK